VIFLPALFTFLLAVVTLLLPLAEGLPTGGLVGWLLLLAGLAEIVFARLHGSSGVGKAALIAGAISALAGLVFVARPFSGFFPVSNVVMISLVIRGLWLVVAAVRLRGSGAGSWLASTGAVDLLLGLLMLVGLSVAALVVSIFGPTEEIVADFALILATSFLVTSIAQFALASGRTGNRGLAPGNR
jgi:uncharacterized membrane protein HdeD (DUF308 family)